MAENKTRPNEASVEGYLKAIEDQTRRQDCASLVEIMAKATGEQAVMWGTGIVGFGSYHYKYDSGREGDSCLVGFSSRKGDISLYLVSDFPGMADLLARLGKYKMGKGCLYIHRLNEVDSSVLEQLVVGAAAERKRHHPQEQGPH